MNLFSLFILLFLFGLSSNRIIVSFYLGNSYISFLLLFVCICSAFISVYYLSFSFINLEISGAQR